MSIAGSWTAEPIAQQLVAHDSELAQQIAKDPLILDFLDLSGEVAERGLEESLTDRIVDTLRELGPGFAFAGRQVHFDVGGEDFYLTCCSSTSSNCGM